MGWNRSSRLSVLGCKNNMDVEIAMRVFILAVCLLAPISSHATELRIFEVDVNLREDCSLEVRRSNGALETKAFPFKDKSKCVVLPVSGTNVPHLEFVRGDYVFLIESQIQSGKDCRAELAAVVVSSNGKVSVGSRIQKTGACGYGERKDFEILHHHAGKR
jgi:hypothetical protein